MLYDFEINLYQVIKCFCKLSEINHVFKNLNVFPRYFKTFTVMIEIRRFSLIYKSENNELFIKS